jgi:hypothetical protein
MFLCAQLMVGGGRTAHAESMPTENGSLLPELHWLQNWLELDADQAQKVKTLHLAYLPKCEELCHRVQLSNDDLLKLSARHSTMDAAMRKAIEERAKLNAECQEALLEHVYQISACLTPDQSKKYLGLMVPYALCIPASDAASRKHHP